MAILSGQRLTPARLNPVLAQLRQTTAQTITNNTWTAVTFGAEDVDTHSGHSTSSNTSRFTIPLDGTYLLAGGVSYAANATGQRWCRWYKNGTELDGGGANINANSSGQTLMVAKTLQVVLAVGDYVELWAFQSSGVSLDTYVAFAYAQSTMNVTRVAP